MMKRKFLYFSLLITLFLIPFFFGCTGQPSPSTPTEDTFYLTPIPQNTLDATVITPPIATKPQAVIAARKEMGTTRLEFSEPPIVVTVEEMHPADVIHLSGFPENTTNPLPADSEVWLVIFEGDYRINPPDPMHTFTPEPPVQGCAAVIIIASSALPYGTGTIACPTSQ